MNVKDVLMVTGYEEGSIRRVAVCVGIETWMIRKDGREGGRGWMLRA